MSLAKLNPTSSSARVVNFSVVVRVSVAALVSTSGSNGGGNVALTEQSR